MVGRVETSLKNSTKRHVQRVLSGLLCVLPLLFLIWELSLSQAPARTQPRTVALTGQENILVLHTFQSNFPAYVKTDQGITSSLRSGGVDLEHQFFEYLDLTRNPSHAHRKVLAELMRSRYGRRKIDMIITQSTEALQFLLNEGRTVFPEVPILALYMHPRIELPKTGRLIIQHSSTIDMIGTVESALRLVPGAKRVYVVGGVSPVDRVFENQARKDFKRWEGQLDFRYLSDMSFEDMLSEVSSAPPGSHRPLYGPHCRYHREDLCAQGCGSALSKSLQGSHLWAVRYPDGTRHRRGLSR